MRAQVWFEGYFFLSLDGTTILSTAYVKRLILSVKQFNIKSDKWENYSKVGIVLEVITEAVVETWIANRCNAAILLYMVPYIFYSILFLKYPSL